MGRKRVRVVKNHPRAEAWDANCVGYRVLVVENAGENQQTACQLPKQRTLGRVTRTGWSKRRQKGERSGRGYALVANGELATAAGSTESVVLR